MYIYQTKIMKLMLANTIIRQIFLEKFINLKTEYIVYIYPWQGQVPTPINPIYI